MAGVRKGVVRTLAVMSFAAVAGILLVGGGPLDLVKHVGAQTGASGNSASLKSSYMLKVAPALKESFSQAPDEAQPFMVFLKDQADLRAAESIDKWSTKGEFVYNNLKQKAARTQKGLLGYLEIQARQGLVESFKSFFIVNAVKVVAKQDVLEALAARPDVDRIEPIKTIRIPEPIVNPTAEPQGTEWGVSRINAPDLWNLGIRGSGVVVANIDTGVQYDHAALVNQYRGTSTGSHDYNWFDPTGISPGFPADNNGHGTHTMGTMVGDDGGSNQIGVAPSAQWIACKGCASSSCSDSDLLSCAEWILAPTDLNGNNPDPSRRPNVVNNSWGGGWSCDTWYQASVQAWRAAGIFPAFSAGNWGEYGSGTIGAPGNYPESFASGATDSGDAIASFSSRGPGACSGASMKPNVSAPGDNVRSSVPTGSYANYSGTSMASPHAAGCVALYLSAHPGTSIADIEAAIENTAADLGSSGFDYDYGYGRIDCYQAVEGVTSPGHLVASPTSFTATLTQGQTSTANLNLSNDGGLSATFNISENEVGSLGRTGQAKGQGTWLYRSNGTSAVESNAKGGQARPGAYRWKLAGKHVQTLRILIYADDAYHLAPDTFLDQALQNLGLEYTAHYDGDFSGFESDLASGSWDLVLFGDDNYGPPSSTFDALEAYVATGGKLIFASWQVSSYYNHTLFNSLGLSFVADDPNAQPVYWWDASSPLFTYPESVPQFTLLTGDRYGTYGQYVNAASGFQPKAGYTTSQTTDMAAMVVGNSGRTIFKGFMDGQNDADLDEDGKYDGVELWMNMITYVSGAGDIPWLRESPTSGSIAAGESTPVQVTFDATNLDPGEYHADLRVNTNTGQDAIVVPVTLTVQDSGPKPSLDLVSTTGMRNGTAVVPIRLTNVSGKEISATSNDVYFDPDIFDDATAEIGEAGEAAGKMVAFNLVEPGMLRVGVLSISDNNPIGDGVVANVLLHVRDSAELGDTVLGNAPSASDPYGNDVPVTGSEAVVSIITIWGDCDGDGQVSIAEVQSAIIMYLEITSTEPCADPNGDGSVSISEVQLIINNYLGLESDTTAKTQGAGRLSSIVLADKAGYAGRKVTIPIKLQAGKTAVSALSNDIRYDSTVLEHPVVVPGPASKAAKKFVVSSKPGNGVFRIGVLGLNNKALRDGIVAYVTFTIKPNAPGGETILRSSPTASSKTGVKASVKTTKKGCSKITIKRNPTRITN